MAFTQVDITERAAEVVRTIRAKHGELIFHQSGGCCDGSTPMLFEKNEFYIDDSDVLLGEVAGVSFYMNRDQYAYWKHTFLTVDITEGRGASFSLEIPLGVRFMIHSRLMRTEELEQLKHT